MEEIKQPFYKKLIASIKDFDKYQEFAVEGVKQGFKYFFRLLLLLSIVVTIGVTVKTGQIISKNINYLKNGDIDFKYEDKKLYINSQDGIIYENSDDIDGIIIVDTNDISEEKMSEYQKKFALYNNGIFLTKDNITIKNEMIQGSIIQSYEEIAKQYNIEDFNKTQFIEYFSEARMIGIYASIFIALLIVFTFMYIIELMVEAITPMILGYISARFIGLKLKISNIFTITVHAMSLSIILRTIYIIVNLYTGFYIKYFNAMYITIIYIYVITALFIIRSNLIKQQLELMKIIEEQKNVKEEIKERENKEKDDNTDEKKDGEKKEDSDKEKKDNNIGKEANGEV